MKPIIEIRSIDALHQAILLQRNTARRVSQEIEDIVKDVTTNDNQHDEEYLFEAALNREVNLLQRYAALPTLVEYARSKGLEGVLEAGATFAVTTIVGEVLLATVRAMVPQFVKAHRTLLFVMLREIDKPTSEDEDLVDTFARHMNIELKEQAWPLSEEERSKLIRGMLRPLTETMVLVCQQFQLIETVDDSGYQITPTGRRVLLHLFAANDFIAAVSEAHPRLKQTLGTRKATPQKTA